MPLYEYECRKCHAQFERIEKLNGPFLKICPKCKGRVERMVSRSAIAFKGSGWYVTDYARNSSAGSKADAAKQESAAGKQETAAAAKDGKAGSAPDGKSEGKSQDKSKEKPAAASTASKSKKTGGSEK